MVLFNSFRMPLIMFLVIPFVFIGKALRLAFGTLLTMVLVPVLYALFYKVPAEQG